MFRLPASIRALRRRHLEKSGRLAPDDGGLTYPDEALSPFSRPFCLRCLQLLDCLVVTLSFFVEVRASQHGEQVVRTRKRQGVHHGATNKHCCARHYFRISAGMRPCLISMSFVAMTKATSTNAGRNVKLRGATPDRHLAKPGISRCEARDYCAVV